jgi:hemolysin activation/secretion protein
MAYKSSWSLRSYVCAAAVSFCSLPAFAQTSAQPGHIDERFQQRPAAPSVGTPLEIPSTPKPAAPSGAAAVTFTVTAVSFEGNTVLPDAQLQAIAAPYTGHPISLANANDLAAKVTAAYRDAGYILVRAVVPAQQIDRGTLRIQILQGYIDKVRIQGDAGGARSYLEAYGARIADTKPLTARVLERELLLASDLAGMNVRSVLTASQTAPGAADLTLVVEPRKVEAFVGVDNRGSRFLGPYEVQGGVFFNDAFGTGGRLGLNGAVTPGIGPDLAYGGVSFDQPLGTDGLRLFSGFSYAATKPGSVLRTFGTEGSAINANSALSYPFIRSRDFNLQGSLGLAYHDIRSSNALVDPLFADHTRDLSATLFMNTLDDWGGYSTASIGITRGLPMLGATKAGDPVKSRVGASGEFTRGNFELTHLQPLADRFSVMLGATGQTSFGDPLLASEQFSLGADSYDRAFDPSEVTGDSALAGRIEPRFDVADHLALLSNVQLYGFFEGGQIWQAQAVAGSPSSQTLGSAGAGFRFLVGDHVNADLEWAKPLDRNVQGSANQNSRFFFSVGVSL